jgi:hypothetical protein
VPLPDTPTSKGQASRGYSTRSKICAVVSSSGYGGENKVQVINSSG